ncbi:hypothetical protein GW17_00002097 [Ensete ventricosum]|nr:hypothetical protein GW17_00002097 [Ensete ventricosum]
MTIRYALTAVPPAFTRSVPLTSSPYVFASKLRQLPLENCICVDANNGGRSSTIPFSWEQCPRIPKSLSHPATTKDAFAHPIPPREVCLGHD